MGNGDRQAPCKHNCGENATGSRPQSTSSTLGPRLNERVRGLGAFPAHTEVARTIASTHGMRRMEPPGRGIAASAANTGGIFCVWGCEGLQPSHSLMDWVVGFSCLRCWSRVFLLCSSSGKHVLHMFHTRAQLCAAIICVFPPSYPVGFPVSDVCSRAHVPIYPCGVRNLS